MALEIIEPNFKEYSPEEVEAFRQRMEEKQRAADEYREETGGLHAVAWGVICFLVVMAAVIYFSWGCWQASDRLVGLGS